MTRRLMLRQTPASSSADCMSGRLPISHSAIDFFSDQYVRLRASLCRDFDILMQLQNT